MREPGRLFCPAPLAATWPQVLGRDGFEVAIEANTAEVRCGKYLFSIQVEPGPQSGRWLHLDDVTWLPVYARIEQCLLASGAAFDNSGALTKRARYLYRLPQDRLDGLWQALRERGYDVSISPAKALCQDRDEKFPGGTIRSDHASVKVETGPALDIVMSRSACFLDLVPRFFLRVSPEMRQLVNGITSLLAGTDAAAMLTPGTPLPIPPGESP